MNLDWTPLNSSRDSVQGRIGSVGLDKGSTPRVPFRTLQFLGLHLVCLLFGSELLLSLSQPLVLEARRMNLGVNTPSGW